MQNFENIARGGLEFVKAHARRDDRVGEVTYRTLEIVSGGLGATARALGQLGDATHPPARTPATRTPANDKTS